MPNIVTSLPLNVDDLCDIFKIVFVGARIPNRVELRKICGVSRQRVRDALLWLKKYNHMYQMIPSKLQIIVCKDIISLIPSVNEANITQLPEDDVPESIWETIERAENMAVGEPERTGFTKDPLEDAIIQGEPNAKNVFPMNTR